MLNAERTQNFRSPCCSQENKVNYESMGEMATNAVFSQEDKNKWTKLPLEFLIYSLALSSQNRSISKAVHLQGLSLV